LDLELELDLDLELELFWSMSAIWILPLPRVARTLVFRQVDEKKIKQRLLTSTPIGTCIRVHTKLSVLSDMTSKIWVIK
jgi:hypothetical protein